MITKKEKEKIIKEFGGNTGTPEVQVAIFTKRIVNLTEHLKNHKKDYSSRKGLITLVGKRRSVLNYIQNKSEENYKALIARLGLRK